MERKPPAPRKPENIPLIREGSAWGPGCLALFMIPFLLAGLGLVGLVGGWFIQKARLDGLTEGGILLPATVVALHATDGESSTHYAVTYEVERPLADPRQHPSTHEEGIPADLFHRLHVGDSLTVLTDPADPTLARIEGNPFRPPLALMLGAAVVWNLLVWPLALSTWGNARQALQSALRLRREGVTAEAVVVNRWSQRDSEGDERFYIGYRFQARFADGALMPYTFGEPVSKATHDQLPIGTTITLRYLPDDPRTVQRVAQ